jgi:sporulation protein YlmC with PRC-barrel domain
MASLKVKQKDGTITQILLGGANGLSLWTAKVEHTDNMELPYSNINSVKNRTIQ